MDLTAIDDVETQEAAPEASEAVAFMKAKDDVNAALDSELFLPTKKDWVGTLLKDCVDKLGPEELKVLQQQGVDHATTLKTLDAKVAAIKAAKAELQTLDRQTER